MLIERFPSVIIIFRHISLSSQCEVPHGICSALRCHNQMFVFTVYSRRAEVVELEVCEAGTPLIEASPFDISPFADPAPQECGTPQLVTQNFKDAGILFLALGLLPLRWWGVNNKARSLDGLIRCVRRGLLHFLPNISALEKCSL